MSIDMKMLDMLKAHYDGVYMLSKRENCDDIVTHLIGDYMTLEKMHRDAEARASKRESSEAPFVVLSPNESTTGVMHFFRAGYNIIISRPLPTTEIEDGK